MTLTTVKASLEQLLTKASEKSQSDIGTTPESQHDDLGSVDDSDALEFVEEDSDDRIEGSDAEESDATFKKLSGVTDMGWRIYRLVVQVASEFDKKFRGMWAK